jgi:hypothetical protein
MTSSSSSSGYEGKAHREKEEPMEITVVPTLKQGGLYLHF